MVIVCHRILIAAIDFDDTSASLEIAMAVAKEFRLSTYQARDIIDEISLAVKQWRHVATALGLNVTLLKHEITTYKNKLF